MTKGDAYWILFLEQNLLKIKVRMMDAFDAESFCCFDH